MTRRNVTAAPEQVCSDLDYPTIREETQDELRFTLYVLCPCAECGWQGRDQSGSRCPKCRGEAKVLSDVAHAATEQDAGAMFITCALEGQLLGCPVGLLDRDGEPGLKWLVLPWLASPRNVSDAGRVLAKSKGKGEQ